MMKKNIISLFMVCSLVTQLFAGDDIEAMENVTHSEVEEHTEEGAFYLIVKGLMTHGDTVPHGNTILDGGRGHGFGLDLGYIFGNGFALEYDFSYATNTVTETDEHHHSEEGNGKYYTHALDILYAYHLTHTLVIFAKAGYEYEIEKIEELHIDRDDYGALFGLGFEVIIDEHYRLILEGEKSTIDGPRGSTTLFAGVMYRF